MRIPGVVICLAHGVVFGALSLAAATAAAHDNVALAAPTNPDYVLTLGEQTFDPLAGVPAPPLGLDQTSSGGDLGLVQFAGPTQDEWLQELQAAGLEIVQYVHPYTYIVWGSAGQRATLNGSHLRWAGEFLPAYRLLPQFRNLDATSIRTEVLVVRFAGTEHIVRALEQMGATVHGSAVLSRAFEHVVFELPGALLPAVANLPGVYTVQPTPTDGGLRGEMFNQVCVNNVAANNAAYPGYDLWLASVGLSGAGVAIANVDGGVYQGHPDLAGRFLPCVGTSCGVPSTGSSHGTHTAGTMAGTGASGTRDAFGFLRGLGIAPGANLVEQLYSPTYTSAGGMLTLMRVSYANGALLSGNSWGPAGSPRGYDNHTMQCDIGVRDTDANVPGDQPLTYVLSIMNGNGGTSTQGTPDEGKNLFTIGSTKGQNTDGSQILQINDLSSNTAHGPCLDGRKIPHMVAPGCRIDSSNSTTGYGLSCGTSMASPHVSGAVALFIEYYRNLDGYEVDPSPALIKAAFLPVAHNLAGFRDANNGLLGVPFDSKQGWGRMNLAAVVTPEVSVRYWDNPVIFDNTGEFWEQQVSAADPTQPMKIMLVWTDAPGHGLGGSTPAWNNDLDLEVSAGAITYRGNDFGANGWSTPNGVKDNRNNTEGVFIGPAADGTYMIRVLAANISSDGLPNYGDLTDQDFAVVCYNCTLEPGFALSRPAAQETCGGGAVTYTLPIVSVAGFDEPVTVTVENLPNGTTALVTPATALPGESVAIDVQTSAATPDGTFQFQIVGTSGELVRSTTTSLKVFAGVPAAPIPVSPADGAINIGILPTLSWNAAPNALSHQLEIATDADFVHIILSIDGLTEASYALGEPLDQVAQYHWRVRSANPCGYGASAAASFTTQAFPAILLVDDDDNSPDVRSFYATAIGTLNLSFDVWDTQAGQSEPSLAEMMPYAHIIWFSGDSWGGTSNPKAGPSPAAEAALATLLNRGRNVMIVGQDYFYDRGLTSFMQNYLGAGSILNDRSQTSATGSGAVYGGLGPYTLSYPFFNWSDVVNPNALGATAFMGDQGSAATMVDSPIFRAVFFGFPLEAIATAQGRAAVMNTTLQWFRPLVDCNGNGFNDHVDLLNGTSLDLNGDGIPDECQAPETCPGDANGDGVVNFADISPFIAAIKAGSAANWTCDLPGGFGPYLNSDTDGDGMVNFADISPFIGLLKAPPAPCVSACP
ncbi:MAG: S8 family serine peptidase [Phycisphaerales bacterium]|nr:S8 family serine peptidase [Phycisphaerales bacterium]